MKKQIFTGCIVLLILFTPFIMLFLCAPYHNYLFQKYDVDEEVKMNKLELVTEEVIEFFIFRRSEISYFDNYENSHMLDVRNLIKYMMAIYSISVVGIFFLLFQRKNLKINIRSALNLASIIVLIITLILSTFSFLDFDKLFWGFHEVLFEEGTFAFDPNVSFMKAIYPDEFFMSFFVTSLIISAIVSIIILLALNWKEIKSKYLYTQ